MTNSDMPGEAEAKFKLLVDAVMDYALYMLDPEGRITTWNSGAQSPIQKFLRRSNTLRFCG